MIITADLTERISLDALCADSVSVRRQNILQLPDGDERVSGDVHRRAYLNSPSGRARLQGSESGGCVKQAIVAVGGDAPSGEDWVFEAREVG